MNKFKLVILELTYRCNFRCNFCYLLNSDFLNKNYKKEISYNDLKNFIDKFKYKTNFFITGGEPTLKNYLPDLIKYIKNKGHNCGINTNGYLLDRKKIINILSAKPDYIIFSLFATNSKLYSKITNAKLNFKKLLNNIKFATEHKTPETETIISYTITKDNISEILKTYKLISKLGMVNRVIYEHLQFVKKEELKLNPLESKKYGKLVTPVYTNYSLNYKKLHREIIKTIKDKKNFTSVEIRPLMNLHQIEMYYNSLIRPSNNSCKSKFKTLIVSPQGNIRLCNMYSKKIGDIKKFNQREILKIKRKLLNKLPQGCTRCCHRFNLFKF